MAKKGLKHEFSRYIKRMCKAPRRCIVALCILLFFLTLPHTIPYPPETTVTTNQIYRKIDIVVPTPDPYPVNKKKAAAPYISAQSAIIIDVDSKAVLYAKNPDLKLSPASTTKMLTALVAIEQYPTHKVASVSSPVLDGQVMFLEKDENITINNLLKGLLIHSANDAAYALADLDPGGKDAFIEKMNQKTTTYGLKDSHFLDPAGLSNGNHYSTVHDLAIIGSHIMEDPILSKIVATKHETVTDITGSIPHELNAINELLDIVPGLKGIKTGWTEAAGECFVAYVERDSHRLITAVLGSYDRFGETVQLVDWAFTNHEWQAIDTTGIYD